MQYVRCDACGAKAILAASRCPKCTEALALRDHHGVLLPLSHCRKCDTYYLSSKGGCKWCGTKPRASVNWSRVAVAVAGFVVASGALWWGLRPRQPSSGGDSAVAQQPAPVSAPAPPVDSGITRDSAVSDSPVAASDSALAVSRPLADSATRAPTPTPVDVGSAWPAAFVLQGRATVSNYANVRAEPVPGARVLAVLAPGVRVEIGGRYRGWRLIRTEGAMGWVDPRNLRLDAAPTR